MDLKELLKYQEIDKKKLDIKREMDAGGLKKRFEDIRKLRANSKNKCLQLESMAKYAKNDYINLSKHFEVLEKGLSDNAEPRDDMTEEEMQEAIKKASDIANNFAVLEKQLVDFARKIDTYSREFENEIAIAKKARVEHDRIAAQLEELEKEFKEKSKSIDDELKELAKKVDKEMLAKYNSMRTDGIFPVLVPLLDGNICGGCRMEMGYNIVDKINNKGHYPCEQCRRLIYRK